MGTALVTGAARGIGFEVARRLAADGAVVTLLDLPGSRVHEAAASLVAEGGRAFGVAGDVTQAADVERAARTAARDGPLDTLVHCAGISPTMAPAAEVLRVNLGGTLTLLAAAEPWLGGGSSVVLIGSTSAALIGVRFDDAIGDPRDGDVIGRLQVHAESPAAAYGIAKRAMILLVRALAFPLGRRGIRINAVSPGLADTPMGSQEEAATPLIPEMQKLLPFPRKARPEEVAAAVAFLAGPEAGFITGVDLLVDGGCVATLGEGWGIRRAREAT